MDYSSFCVIVYFMIVCRCYVLFVSFVTFMFVLLSVDVWCLWVLDLFECWTYVCGLRLWFWVLGTL